MYYLLFYLSIKHYEEDLLQSYRKQPIVINKKYWFLIANYFNLNDLMFANTQSVPVHLFAVFKHANRELLVSYLNFHIVRV